MNIRCNVLIHYLLFRGDSISKLVIRPTCRYSIGSVGICHGMMEKDLRAQLFNS